MLSGFGGKRRLLCTEEEVKFSVAIQWRRMIIVVH